MASPKLESSKAWKLGSFILALASCGAPCIVRDGRCERVACPANAHFEKDQCVCDSGTNVLGACMSPKDADALCGTASRPAAGGCLRKRCAARETLDDATGICLPPGLRTVAENMNIPILDDETLSCSRKDDRLLVSGPHAACVPELAACGVGARMTANGCASERACAAGEVTSSRGVCMRVVLPGPEGPLVDVAVWAREVLGTDGGFGSSYLCGPLSVQPWTFTTITDLTITVALDIDLSFPDNDVSEVRVRVQGHDAQSGQPIVGLEVVESAMRPLISSLRALGGTARAAQVSTHVRCGVPVGPRPVAVPRGAGDSAR